MALLDDKFFEIGEVLIDDEPIVMLVGQFTGELLSRTEAEVLIGNMERLYSLISDDALDSFNEQRKKEVRDEWIERIEGASIGSGGTKRTKRNISGFVYVLKEKFKGTYKIGRTTNIKDRGRVFGNKLPFDWDFTHIYKSENHIELEDMLHERFSNRRVNGEWFSLNEEDLAFLNKGILDSKNFKGLISEVIPCP